MWNSVNSREYTKKSKVWTHEIFCEFMKYFVNSRNPLGIHEKWREFLKSAFKFTKNDVNSRKVVIYDRFVFHGMKFMQ